MEVLLFIFDFTITVFIKGSYLQKREIIPKPKIATPPYANDAILIVPAPTAIPIPEVIMMISATLRLIML